MDGPAPTWTIPGRRMKGRHTKAATRKDHVVPLSRQAVEILLELRHLTGRFRLVFPGVRKVSTPLSVNTLTAALRSIGYSGKEQTAHGFRSTAMTLLREEGYETALIRAQMAHGIENKVEAAYNRAEYIAKRRTMMQTWADYLDGLREIARAKRASEGGK
jgi:integrase